MRSVEVANAVGHAHNHFCVPGRTSEQQVVIRNAATERNSHGDAASLRVANLTLN